MLSLRSWGRCSWWMAYIICEYWREQSWYLDEDPECPQENETYQRFATSYLWQRVISLWLLIQNVRDEYCVTGTSNHYVYEMLKWKDDVKSPTMSMKCWSGRVMYDHPLCIWNVLDGRACVCHPWVEKVCKMEGHVQSPISLASLASYINCHWYNLRGVFEMSSASRYMCMCPI